MDKILFTISLELKYSPLSSYTGSFPTNTKVLSPNASQSFIFCIISSLAASRLGVVINAKPAFFGISISEKFIFLCKGFPPTPLKIFPSICKSPVSSPILPNLENETTPL